jgi:hypothetical protein
MRGKGWIGLAALLVLVGCGKPQSDEKSADKKSDDAPGVTLSADQIAALGITTQPAAAGQYRAQASGYGVVTALDTIAQTDAEFMTAQAAAAQSQAAAARAQSLATGEEAAVSRELVEAAQSKAAADQAALALAGRKADAAFGQNAPWQDAASRSAIMARLASGKTVLVRVTFPQDAGGPSPASLQIARLGAAPKSWTSNKVWDAPADPTFPGRGFYALVDGSDLAQNEHVTASVPVGAPRAGVLVPAKALVYGESEAWVYVQTKPGTFQRTRIDTGNATGESYFVAANGGIHPGQAVVVNGAGLLLARETNPSTEAEE